MIRWVLGVLIAMVPLLGTAQSVRCGGKIINEGVTKAVVLASCGTPTQVGNRSGALEPAFGEVTPPSSDDGQIDVWTYNFGPTRLMQRIWFEDGLVKRVESLGYGH
ncbi:MAG: DUF2845 domain-containing protein [Terriglobales bacterium]